MPAPECQSCSSNVRRGTLSSLCTQLETADRLSPKPRERNPSMASQRGEKVRRRMRASHSPTRKCEPSTATCQSCLIGAQLSIPYRDQQRRHSPCPRTTPKHGRKGARIAYRKRLQTVHAAPDCAQQMPAPYDIATNSPARTANQRHSQPAAQPKTPLLPPCQAEHKHQASPRAAKPALRPCTQPQP